MLFKFIFQEYRLALILYFQNADPYENHFLRHCSGDTKKTLNTLIVFE